MVRRCLFRQVTSRDRIICYLKFGLKSEYAPFWIRHLGLSLYGGPYLQTQQTILETQQRLFQTQHSII